MCVCVCIYMYMNVYVCVLIYMIVHYKEVGFNLFQKTLFLIYLELFI